MLFVVEQSDWLSPRFGRIGIVYYNVGEVTALRPYVHSCKVCHLAVSSFSQISFHSERNFKL